MLAEFDKLNPLAEGLCKEEKVVKEQVWGTWQTLKKQEKEDEKEHETEDEKAEIEQDDWLDHKEISKLQSIILSSINSVTLHNKHLEEAVIERLDQLTRTIGADIQRKVKKEKVRANKKCNRMQDMLEKEQNAKHKLENALSVLDDENIGFINVLRIRREELQGYFTFFQLINLLRKEFRDISLKKEISEDLQILDSEWSRRYSTGPRGRI